MQQFRPLPNFAKIEEAEPVALPPEATTDPIPSVAPYITTGKIPVVLLTGPHPTPDTDRLAALTKPPIETTHHTSLISALQSTMNTQTTSSTGRYMVIPADVRRKKKVPAANAKVRRLNPHLRNGIIFLAVVGVLVATLATLAPLSDNSDGGNLFTSLGVLIHNVQVNWQVQAHQNMSQAQTNPNLPAMVIADSQYVSVAQQAALAASISPVYFVRQINQESRFNPNAVSPAGAEGIAQFMPSTAASLGVNPWDPTQALYGAARMMASSYHQYGDYAKALAAYNAGPGQLQSAMYACGVNWLSCMPAETQNYVYVIMGV
jgi:hypothetical protein